ncbi:BnaC03g41080D [Brassica napus]|uniref:BnaC03g41080D protein n=1 Tax=Brassica napus TaxID=3708 RepID=A0A078GC61_BRANA|nr:BnaC03g41080D [Brassica napus]
MEADPGRILDTYCRSIRRKTEGLLCRLRWKELGNGANQTAAVDLSLDACKLFSHKLRKELRQQSQLGVV